MEDKSKERGKVSHVIPMYVLSRISVNRQTAINRRSRVIVMGKDGAARNFEKIDYGRDDDRCGAVRRGK